MFEVQVTVLEFSANVEGSSLHNKKISEPLDGNNDNPVTSLILI